jgi:Bax protein
LIKRQYLTLFLAVILTLIITFFALSHYLGTGGISHTKAGQRLPNFSQFTAVGEKKTAFFEFMLPLVEAENQRLSAQRKQLEIIKQQTAALTTNQLKWLHRLAEEYRLSHSLDPQQLIHSLWLRVDQVPPSMALAQAANESAWGTSRFAKQGNNLFGQWCFTAGCGLIPQHRSEGKSHEVAKFSSPQASVTSYIHNLNSHSAYQEFRQIRASQRQQFNRLSGQQCVEGLLKYSSRGEEYIQELQAMIRVNKLHRYDTI